ncbi:unnamed protein product [Brassica rapa]|uniref:Uncharacterized protein n=1 Tax=Brassica campestris TaxID=3711 RepID=A0A3P5YAI5_BRACM|nr:unnamed protein product [Brassica rapa]VDC59625.1 unnamed protein product [Brassica rapa]
MYAYHNRCSHLDNCIRLRVSIVWSSITVLRGGVRKLERIAGSEEEEESEKAEGSESETEETSKKQMRVEGVSAEVKKMREEASVG